MKQIIKIFVILFVLSSCQSAQDAFSLKKRNSTDEFLVEKKNPLVLPPEFGKLPLPKQNKIESNQSDVEIANILGSNNEITKSKEKKNSSKQLSIEKSILEKIK